MSEGLPPSLRRRLLLLRAHEEDERSSACETLSELSPTVQDLPQDWDLQTHPSHDALRHGERAERGEKGHLQLEVHDNFDQWRQER